MKPESSPSEARAYRIASICYGLAMLVIAVLVALKAGGAP